MAKHRGWWVHAPGAKSVSYPTRARAQRTAKSIKGAKVSRSSSSRDGCFPVIMILMASSMAVSTGLYEVFRVVWDLI